MAGLALRNLTLRAGASNAVCFSGGGVSGTVMDRLTVTDIGGRAVEGCAAALSFAVVGTVLANSTISRVGFNYMSGGAAAVIGTGAAFVHNEVFDVPLNGVTFQQAGGASRPEAPSAEIAFNHIHDFGGGGQVLSDFGGVYINANSDAKPATNWLATDVHHNLIERGASYDYGCNGIYTDHGTSGASVHHNVVAALGGRGLSPHAGLNLSAANNLFYNVSLQPFAGAAGASCVVSGPQGNAPGFSLALRANIFAQPAGGSAVFYSTRDAFWAPPRARVASDGNVFWAGAAGAGLFPDGKGGATGLAGWRALSAQDAGSAEADPLLAAPQAGDFRVLPASPAWARGWQEIDLSSVGPLP